MKKIFKAHIITLFLLASIGYGTANYESTRLNSCHSGSGIVTENNCVYDYVLDIYYPRVFLGSNYTFNDGVLISSRHQSFPAIFHTADITSNYIFNSNTNIASLFHLYSLVIQDRGVADIEGTNHTFNSRILVSEKGEFKLSGMNHTLHRTTQHNEAIIIRGDSKADIKGTNHTFNGRILVKDSTLSLDGKEHTLNGIAQQGEFITAIQNLVEQQGVINLLLPLLLTEEGTSNYQDPVLAITGNNSHISINGDNHKIHGSVLINADELDMFSPKASLTIDGSNHIYYGSPENNISEIFDLSIFDDFGSFIGSLGELGIDLDSLDLGGGLEGLDANLLIEAGIGDLLTELSIDHSILENFSFNTLLANEHILSLFSADNFETFNISQPSVKVSNGLLNISGYNHKFHGAVIVDSGKLDISGSGHKFYAGEYSGKSIILTNTTAEIKGNDHEFNRIVTSSGDLVIEGNGHKFTSTSKFGEVLDTVFGVTFIKGNDLEFNGKITGVVAITGLEGTNLVFNPAQDIHTDSTLKTSFTSLLRGMILLSGNNITINGEVFSHGTSSAFRAEGMVLEEGDSYKGITFNNKLKAVRNGTISVSGNDILFTSDNILDDDYMLEAISGGAISLAGETGDIDNSNYTFNGKLRAHDGGKIEIFGKNHIFNDKLEATDGGIILISALQDKTGSHIFNVAQNEVAIEIGREAEVELGNSGYIIEGITTIDQGTLTISGNSHTLAELQPQGSLAFKGDKYHVDSGTYQLEIEYIDKLYTHDDVKISYAFDLSAIDLGETLFLSVLEIVEGRIIAEDQSNLTVAPFTLGNLELLNLDREMIFTITNTADGQKLSVKIEKGNDLKGLISHNKEAEYLSDIGDKIIAGEIESTAKLNDMYNAMLYNQLKLYHANNPQGASTTIPVDYSASTLPISSEVYLLDVYSTGKQMIEDIFIADQSGIIGYISPMMMYSKLKTKGLVQGNSGYKGGLKAGVSWKQEENEIVGEVYGGAGNIRSEVVKGAGLYEIENVILGGHLGWKVEYGDIVLKVIGGYSYNSYDSERDVEILGVALEGDIPLSNSSTVSKGSHVVHGIPMSIEVGLQTGTKEIWIEPALYSKGTVVIFEDYQEAGSAGDVKVTGLGTTWVGEIGVKMQVGTKVIISTISVEPEVSVSTGYRYYNAEATEFTLVDSEIKNELDAYNYKGIYMSPGVGLQVSGESGIALMMKYSGDILFKGTIDHSLAVSLGYSF